MAQSIWIDVKSIGSGDIKGSLYFTSLDVSFGAKCEPHKARHTVSILRDILTRAFS